MKMKKILLKKFLFVELLASQVEIVESLLHSFSRFHPVADGVNAMLAVSATFDERIAVYLIKPFPISHHQQGFTISSVLIHLSPRSSPHSDPLIILGENGNGCGKWEWG